MSNAKHTPGPWSVQYGLHADPEQYTPGIDGGNGETIILFGIKSEGDECGIRGSTVDEQEANARLIAAAPEHHAVALELDRLMLVIESAVRWQDQANHAAVLAMLKANRAAIAKATQEQK